MKTPQQQAEALARECALAIRRSCISDYTQTIIEHIPLTELLAVAHSAEEFLNTGWSGPLEKSVAALRSKLPKENV